MTDRSGNSYPIIICYWFIYIWSRYV